MILLAILPRLLIAFAIIAQNDPTLYHMVAFTVLNRNILLYPT